MRTGAWFVVLSFLTAAADAHVTVWPRESKAAAGEKYTVRVPTEGKVATSSVELEVPEGVTVIAVATPNAWTYELKREGDRIVAITWKMEIKPGEFAEFSFLARNPKEGAQIAWKVRQLYTDGTSSDWVGATGTPRPAPVTKLLPATTP